MFTPDKLENILCELEEDKEKFKVILDKVLKFAVATFNSVEELQEELIDIEDIYQAFIDEIDMQYWIKVSDEKMEYHQGVNESASVRAWFTCNLIINILKGEAVGSEAYMKGVIKAHGSLSQGLRYIKLYRAFFRYINAKYKLHGYPG